MRRCSATAALLALVIGCSDGVTTVTNTTETGERQYGYGDLSNGLEFEIDDPDGTVESATLLVADVLDGYDALTSRLEADGVAAVAGDGTTYDVIALYRTGPYCGLIPDARFAAEPEPRLTVRSRVDPSGECDSMEYDEAIGLVLTRPIDVGELTVDHSVEPFTGPDD